MDVGVKKSIAKNLPQSRFQQILRQCFGLDVPTTPGNLTLPRAQGTENLTQWDPLYVLGSKHSRTGKLGIGFGNHLSGAIPGEPAEPRDVVKLVTEIDL